MFKILKYLLLFIDISNACTSFYCINHCGSSFVKNKNIKQTNGYKLILANNRDEDIYRPTWPARAWPPRKPNSTMINSSVYCDQSKNKPPFNLCGILIKKNISLEYIL
jgi:hypothetical protein